MAPREGPRLQLSFLERGGRNGLISDRKRWPEQLSHLRVISLLFFTFSHVTQINHGFKVASMAPQI